MPHVLEWSCHIALPKGFPSKAEVQSAFQKILEGHSRMDSLQDFFCVHLLLIGDSEMRSINYETRGKDTSTDVLSFPLLPIPVGPGSSLFRSTKPDSIRKRLETGLETEEQLFPSTPGDAVFLGEIVLSVPACLRQATEIGHTVREEFYRLFVHGLLHLFGYDHETGEEDQKRMEAQEDELLKFALHF